MLARFKRRFFKLTAYQIIKRLHGIVVLVISTMRESLFSRCVAKGYGVFRGKATTRRSMKGSIFRKRRKCIAAHVMYLWRQTPHVSTIRRSIAA